MCFSCDSNLLNCFFTEHYEQLIQKAIRRYGCSKGEAVDLIGQAYLKLIPKQNILDESGNLEAYVSTLVHWIFLDEWERRMKRATHSNFEDFHAKGANLEEAIASEDSFSFFLKLLQKRDPRLPDVIHHRQIGLSLSESAGLLSVTKDQIRKDRQKIKRLWMRFGS